MFFLRCNGYPREGFQGETPVAGTSHDVAGLAAPRAECGLRVRLALSARARYGRADFSVRLTVFPVAGQHFLDRVDGLVVTRL